MSQPLVPYTFSSYTNGNKMFSSPKEAIKYSQQIKRLRKDIQDKVVSFFSEDRHYSVCLGEMEQCLELGSKLIYAHSLDELDDIFDSFKIFAVVFYKKSYDYVSIEGVSEDLELVENKIDQLSDNINFPIYATYHGFMKESDPVDEWYILVGEDK